MGSSGGGGDGGAGMMAMMGQGTPMPGLPVAGKDSTIGDAYEYGQFQNFLPDPVAEGQNPMATGLRPEMFEYEKPGGGNPQADALRAQLAAAMAGGGGGGGAPGAMGMGRMGFGGGGLPGGIQGPQTPGANPVAQGSGPIVHPVPWWPKGGIGSPIAAAANNSDPAAAAAAAAALKASGG